MSPGNQKGHPRPSGSSKSELKSSKPDKKPFDKKKWRENKYSNTLKVQKFQEQRELSMKRKYLRMLRKEGSGSNPNLVPLGAGKARPESGGEVARKSYKKTKEEFERRQKLAEKKQMLEEKKEKFLERQAAIKAHREKKMERNKILMKKTKKGQPLLSGRMEMLLDKIRSQEP